MSCLEGGSSRRGRWLVENCAHVHTAKNSHFREETCFEQFKPLEGEGEVETTVRIVAVLCLRGYGG